MTENKHGYSIFDGTIADMTWMEVEQAAINNAIMLVPIGTIEQHGPHLPLGTDTYGAYILSLLTKKELEKQNIPTVIAPPYYYGITYATRMFPGSVNIKNETMTLVLTELLVSYMNSGFKKQFIINHHGEPAHNHAILDSIVNAKERGVDATFVAAGLLNEIVIPDEWNIPESFAIRAKPSREALEMYRAEFDIHAGEKETSMIMRWFPKTLRDVDNIGGYVPVSLDREEIRRRAIEDWRKHFPLGYLGSPHLAERRKGESYLYFARDTANAIAELLDSQ